MKLIMRLKVKYTECLYESMIFSITDWSKYAKVSYVTRII